MICTTDTAAIVGSIWLMMLSNIFPGNLICEPTRNIAPTSSSNDAMKARNVADTIDGCKTDSVTDQTAR